MLFSWILVISLYSNGTKLTFSPPVKTLEDCQSLASVAEALSSAALKMKCVQVSK